MGMDSVSRFVGSSKFCWVGRLTDGKTSDPSGTEILSLLSLAPDIEEKVVAVVIDSPSKHCLHIRVVQELLLQMSLSFPVQPACMHTLLSFWILPDIISGNVLQLQNACVCPPSDEKSLNCIDSFVNPEPSHKQSTMHIQYQQC
jgi:hypothetical protein